MESGIKEMIEEFMGSTLAQWVELFENMVENETSIQLYSQYMEVNSVSQNALERYKRLTNGIFLNEVMRIDPNPKVERLYNSEKDDHMLRVQNFSILNRHLRAFYQEDLQQLILMPLPNVAILGQDPLTCENKETFIQQIQSLDIETQAAIAICIQQVTQDPRVVLPLQWEELVEAEGVELQLVFSSMAKQIQSLLAQRDTHLERIAELCQERETHGDSTQTALGGHLDDPPQSLALQLADSKAKLRRLKQQERDTERQRVDELLEMNMSLEADLRQRSTSKGGVSPTNVTIHQRFLQSELDSDEQKPLSVEVGEASALRLLGAEQENAELRRRLEELQAQQEKNENGTLKQRLEELLRELQHLQEKRKEEGVKKLGREKEKEEEEGEAVRGVQGSESSRGEGEGRVRLMEEREKRGEIIGTRREAGVGEEGLHVQVGKGEVCDEDIQSKWRGEAEGGQKELEKQEKEPKIQNAGSETVQHPIDDNAETAETHQDTCSSSGPDLALLTSRFQEVQEEADRQAKSAQELRSKLGEQSRKTWEAEQKLVLVEAELQRLRKAGESLMEARRHIEVLQSEGLNMEEELCRLRSQAELHRMQTTVIATLEGERAALERDRDTLRSTVDALRAAQRKTDQLELTIQTLRAELERQGRSLETSRRREEQLEAELHEATLEAKSLVRARDQALLEASRLEQEKDLCQSELDGERKEGRQREREAARLRQQLESTTLALEHSNQRACALDAEHRVCQQLTESKELSARLQDLEKKLSRAVAAARQEALQMRLSQSQEACEHLKEQLEALRRHSLSLQDSCTSLQTLNTQLQVEQASLNSQHAIVLARCSESEARRAALEAESKVWAREREESVSRMEALRRDHERMTALQQQQEVELEELLEKYSQLRAGYRSLEGQHRELEGLQAQQKDWLASQAELLAQGSVLKAELSASQLEKTRLEGELSALRETNQSLDLSSARLTSQYQLLTQLKGNMEEENRHLAEQNQSLLKENRALLEQSLERRDQHYSQQQEYKSNWIADRMKKLIKPRGGGGREGRALFTAAGSIENLASAPVSPLLLRKTSSNPEPDISVPGTPTVARYGPRRKLGSRHGWGIGLSRAGTGVSQSFSPGDNKAPPRQRLRSSQNSTNV
uniref:Coiled-coil domain containing 88B n=1 Tax=Xiphophorus couchianus TaxID=32473 RepID=A0A3B5L2S4_9TELE